MSISNTPDSDFIIEAIKQAIKSETEKKIKEAVESISEEMEKRTPEIIAGILIDVMRMADVQILQDKIICTIRKK